MSVLLYIQSSKLAGYASTHTHTHTHTHSLTDSLQKQYAANSWVCDPAEKLSVINVECLISDTLPYDCNTDTHNWEEVCVVCVCV